MGDSVDFVNIGIGLVGGLALFLYGMHTMSEGLRAAAGDGMKNLLARLTTNRFTAAVSGAVVTAVIQSSSGAVQAQPCLVPIFSTTYTSAKFFSTGL